MARVFLLVPFLLLMGCNASPDSEAVASEAPAEAASAPFTATAVADFDEPWAMTFLPDGRLLVTEKAGKLFLVTQEGQKTAVAGAPTVDYGGQGGLGDVITHPDFAQNKTIYLSFVEAGEDDTRGAAIARATLSSSDAGAELGDLEVIWRQSPKVTGRGHFSHRMAFSPDGYLFIASGDRQKFTPAQDMQQSLGKVIRLNDDGSVPADNPFAEQGGIAAQVWSLGHRNILGLAFDANGKLWEHEMGPAGGDEFNLIVRGENYGYPIVSDGNHYDGSPIPNHDTHPEFAAPKIQWTPVIAPAGLIIYSGVLFPSWQGDALIGGLRTQALIRVKLKGDEAVEAARYDMGKRIREVEQGPDGSVWLLEDEVGGRLLRLTPTP